MKNRALWKILEHVEEAVCLFFFASMCVFVFVQLFFRFVLNNPLMYPEEIARASYVWVTFVGMSFATKTRDHISVDYFISVLPPTPARWLTLLVDVMMLAALVLLGWFGVKFVIFSRMSITPALEVPANLYYISFPIGCFLSVVRQLRNIALDFRRTPLAGTRAHAPLEPGYLGSSGESDTKSM